MRKELIASKPALPLDKNGNIENLPPSPEGREAEEIKRRRLREKLRQRARRKK